MSEASDLELSRDLSDWVSTASGATPVRAKRLAGGGSRLTILVDAERPDGSATPLVLRLEGGGSHSGTSFSLEREFHVYRALERQDVPVPKAYGLTPDGSALLLERIEGTADFHQMSPDDQASVAARFMEALGRLHAIDVNDLDLPGFERPVTAPEHATVDLDRWEKLARQSCWNEPLVRYAFARLRASAPSTVQRTVLVQGDTGPGNFMALPERITGLIDWEFSHVGDPMDDFGWLQMRVRDKLPLFEAAYPAYEQISGLTVEPASVSYYHKMVMLRCAVTVALGNTKGGALGVIPYRASFWTYLVRLAEMMVRDAGLDVPRDLPPAEAAAANPMFSEARGELRKHVLGEITSYRGRMAVQSAMIALTSLELRQRFGAQLEAQDRVDRERLFGSRPPASLADEADRAGIDGDPAMLAYLARRTWRERSLWPR